MNSQIVTINLVPNTSAPAVINLSQGDVGRPITFKVLDGIGLSNMLEYGMTAKVNGTKPSGLGFSVTATIGSNGIVTLETTEEMTQECGRIEAEISFEKTGFVVGTANFVLNIEQSPHPEGTTDGTQETMANLETRLQGEIDALDSRIDAIEGDESVSQQISALDARVTALEQGGGSGLTQTEKELILTLFSKAAYAESDAGTAYDELEELWTTTTRTITYNLSHVVSSNTATSIENGQRYTTTFGVQTNYTLNSVKVTMGGVDITATAYSSGTVTIPSVTGNIVITATAISAVTSISAVYSQTGEIYTDDTLDDLKSDLVVTATHSDGTTTAETDYTLSGTLTEGTNTITVGYGGKTDTFNVTVTAPLYSIPDFAEQTVTKSGRTSTVKKENGYYTVIGKYTDVAYIYPDGTVNTSKSDTLWFTTPADKPILHEVYDITWNNPNSMTIDLSGKFSQSDATGNLASAIYTMSANGSGTDASAEFSNEAYSTKNFSGYGIQAYHSGSNHSNDVSVSFKMRLFCDGVRYL